MKSNDSRQPSGSLRISRDVIAAIAKAAAREVKGVYSIASAPIDFKDIVAQRALPKAVSVNLCDDVAVLELKLVLEQDAKIPTVTLRVQQAVKEAVQNMTGITVSRVDITVAGIHFEPAAAQV